MVVCNIVGVSAAVGGTPYVISHVYRCPSMVDTRKKGFSVIYESTTTFTHRLYIQIYYGIRAAKTAGRDSFF